jgi:hypothetical protein
LKLLLLQYAQELRLDTAVNLRDLVEE